MGHFLSSKGTDTLGTNPAVPGSNARQKFLPLKIRKGFQCQGIIGKGLSPALIENKLKTSWFSKSKAAQAKAAICIQRVRLKTNSLWSWGGREGKGEENAFLKGDKTP